MNYLQVTGLCVLFLALGSCSGSSTEIPESSTSPADSSTPNPETPESPENEVTQVTGPDIYLLIGQSNMHGWGSIDPDSATGLEADNSRILQLNVKANPSNDDTYTLDEFLEVYPPSSVAPLVTAMDPLHKPVESGAKSERLISIGLSFARASLNYFDRTVVLVPAAMGGTGFCDNPERGAEWNVRLPTNPAFGNDWLFQRAVKRTNAAIDESGGVLRGIIWHQGESDSGSFLCANAYQDNLIQLVEELRTEIKSDSLGAAFRGPDAQVPFVVGTMSRGSDSRGDLSVFNETKTVVDTAHRLIGETLPYAGFANGDDLVPPAYPCGAVSCIHYGAEALQELGVRYFDAFLRIRQ